MSLTGLIVGWRIRDVVLRGAGGVPAAAALRLRVLVGDGLRRARRSAAPEVVNNASFIVIFPLTFIANTFVPIDNFPPVLKCVRGVEPGLVGDAYAARQLFGNLRPAPPAEQSWPLQHPVLYTLLWVGRDPGGLRAAAVRQYKRRQPLSNTRGAVEAAG